MCCYNPRDKYKWHFFQIIFGWGSSLASLHQNSGAKVSAGDGGGKKLAINRLRTDHIMKKQAPSSENHKLTSSSDWSWGKTEDDSWRKIIAELIHF